MILLHKRHPNSTAYVLIGLLIVFISYSLLNTRYDYLQLTIIAAVAALFVYLLLFGKQYLIYLSIISIPLSVRYGIGGSEAMMSIPGEPLVILLILILLWKVLSDRFLDKRILTHPLTILLLVDLGWLILSSFYSKDVVVSLKRVMVRAGFVGAYFLFFAHWFQNKKNIPKFYFLYAFGLIYVIFKVFSNHAHHNFTVQTSFLITQPFYSDHTVYGTTLAFLLPVFVVLLIKSKSFRFPVLLKFSLLIVIALMFVAEILSFSRAATLSLIVAFTFYGLILLKLRMRGFMILLTLSAGVVFVSYNAIYKIIKETQAVSNQPNYAQHLQSVTNISTDNSNLERINRWVCAIRMFQERPITGFGPGTYQFEYGRFQTRNEMTYLSTFHGDKGNAHSEYLTYLSEAGLPGMLNFILIVLVSIATGFSIINRSNDPKDKFLATGILLSLIGYFFHGFFNSFIDQDKIAILVFGSMAALVALDCSDGATKEQQLSE